MREFAVRLLQLDRRFIFVLMSVVTVLPLLYPLGLPVRISPETRQLYDTLERLPERSVVLLSLDFDPASKPELYPMTVSLLRHAFARNLRVVALTLWPAGTSMAESVVTHGAEEAGKKGRDGLRFPRLWTWGSQRYHQYRAEPDQCLPDRLCGPKNRSAARARRGPQLTRY